MLELTKVTRGKEAEKAHICLPCYACLPHPVPCTPDIPCGPGFCLPDTIIATHCYPDEGPISAFCSPEYVFKPEKF